MTADAERRDLPANSTDKERADAFGPFKAQSGMYEVKGNEITWTSTVAKNPSTMKPGIFDTYTFHMEGRDTLWVSEKVNQNGPYPAPVTLKLVRVE